MEIIELFGELVSAGRSPQGHVYLILADGDQVGLSITRDRPDDGIGIVLAPDVDIEIVPPPDDTKRYSVDDLLADFELDSRDFPELENITNELSDLTEAYRSGIPPFLAESLDDIFKKLMKLESDFGKIITTKLETLR